ncbi:MAG: prepilin peptidase [Chloroflexi bacterium]|nr:prepilin peptidase [Chloroflexota bacterium]
MMAIWLALGAAVGSFLNVCADRIPSGRSVVRPGSYCESCATPLGFVDLIPVLSLLWLRGRCRHCRAPIPGRLLIVETITAVVFGLVWYYSPTTLEATVYAMHASLLILVAIIDLQHQLILNKITYPWAVAALALSAFLPEVGLWRAGVGAAIALGLFGAIFALAPQGMGFGDVKLAGVIGLVVGFPAVLVALVLGAVSGGIVGAALLLAGRKGRKDALPFGVFLSIGGIVSLLWGPVLWGAYLRWII